MKASTTLGAVHCQADRRSRGPSRIDLTERCSRTMYCQREELRGPSLYRGHDDGIYINDETCNLYWLCVTAQRPRPKRRPEGDATRGLTEGALYRLPIRNGACDKKLVLGSIATLCYRALALSQSITVATEQGTSYKLFSIDRFSYIVPTMAGHDGRKNSVLHASNYIVHLYPTVQKPPSVLIVITAYSNSVTTLRESAYLNLQSSNT